MSSLCHDAAEQVVGAVAKGWGRSLRRTGVLGRTADCRSAGVSPTGLQLAVKSLDLLIVFLLKCQMRLLHGIHFLSHHLHFLYLLGNRVLVFAASASLVLELSADTIQQLVEASIPRSRP